MKAARLLVAALVVASLGLAVQAQEKKADLKKQLVGKWEAIEVDEGTLPKGAVVEFGADGKMKVTGKQGDTERKHEGTYTVEGDSFTIMLKDGEREIKQKILVKKITDTELATESPEGKKVKLKRVK
jgi:uncharacterized protein (TIGR03066 family)